MPTRHPDHLRRRALGWATVLALLGGSALHVTDAAASVTISGEFAPAFGGGTSTAPASMVVFDNRLVLHGPFTSAGSMSVSSGPAAWDGSGFTTAALPTNIPSGPMSTYGGGLLFGNATWDGSSLQDLKGTETFGILSVSSHCEGPGGLVAVADITPDPTQHLRRHLIQWDGTEWTVLAAFDNGTKALVEFDGAWFLGNNFSIYPDGGDPGPMLRFDGNWTAYPETSTILNLCVVGSDLYAATFHGLFIWNGSGFDLIAGTETGEFHHVIAWPGGILASGSFPYGLDGSVAGNVAAWNGSSWTPLPQLGAQSPDSYPDRVQRLAVFDGDLYAAGGFQTGSQPEPAAGLARLVGNQWVGLESQIGWGLPSQGLHLGAHEDAIYASATASRKDATFVLQDNGWKEISSDLRDVVNDFVSTPGGLVAVGFRYQGNSTQATVERRVGEAWSALAIGTHAGPQASANASTYYGGRVIVGGSFQLLDGTPASSIAAHNGTVWEPLGAGIVGNVMDLIEFEGDLVAVGQFTLAGNIAVSNVARWDGRAWSNMGGGFSSYATCLELVDGVLYAGGAIQFTSTGYAPYLTRWDGSQWQPIPSPPNGLVEDLAAMGGDLFVSGNFTQVGGVGANGFGRFDPASQSWIDPGFLPNGKIEDFLVQGNDLYLTGAFTSVTGIASHHAAKVTFGSAVDAPSATSALRSRFTDIFPNPGNPKVNLHYEVPRSGRVEIRIYDSRGRQVRCLVDAWTAAGSHAATWNGVDDRGHRASSGVYFARLRSTGGDLDSGRVVLVQ